MTFHLLLPRQMQLGAAAEQSARLESPRHAMALLADNLGATVHEPAKTENGRRNRVGAKLLPPVALWELARKVRATAGAGDAVFCSSEAGGLQLAAVSGARGSRPAIAVFVHNVD